MSGGNYSSHHAFLNASRWFGRRLLLAMVVIVGVAFPVIAQDDAAAISQGFETSDPNLTVGALVSTEPEKQNSVQLANTNRASNLVGVVGEKALIELSGSANQIAVVISGTTFALVSDINGTVKNGDKIAASPINGVGMRSDGGVQVVGTAQADFSTIETTERSVTDKKGATQFVRVGLLPVQVNVTYTPPPDNTTSFLPSFLQQFADEIAGRDVSQTRLLAGIFVLLVGFFSMGVLLYSSVQSSIISIGRNPLSERAVRKSLLQVGATALGILLLTLIAIYLILRV